MNGVMDRIQIQLFCLLGKSGLAGGGAVLSVDTHLQVLLGGIGEDFAQKLSKLGGVLGFFQSCSVIVITDFGITFTESLSGHGQIHAYFAALTGEVLAETLNDLFGSTLCNTDNMLSGPGQILCLLGEFLAGAFADGAKLRSFFSFFNIATNRAYPFFHDNDPP